MIDRVAMISAHLRACLPARLWGRLWACRKGGHRGGLAPLCLLFVAGLLAGCVDGRDLDQPAAPLGDFQLGHNVVIAPNLTQGPLSRDASQEEWSTAIEAAIENRFRRYEGERVYHFGVSVEGYVLAQTGVPLVLQPKSVVIFRLTVWDDALQAKLNPEPQEITVLEAISAKSVAGSGLTQTRDEQLDNLAVLAAKQIEEFLLKQKQSAGWFEGFRPAAAPDAAEGGLDPAEVTPGGQAVRDTGAASGDGPADAPAMAEEMLVVEPLEAVTDPEVVPPRPAPMRGSNPGGSAPRERPLLGAAGTAP